MPAQSKERPPKLAPGETPSKILLTSPATGIVVLRASQDGTALQRNPHQWTQSKLLYLRVNELITQDWGASNIDLHATDSVEEDMVGPLVSVEFLRTLHVINTSLGAWGESKENKKGNGRGNRTALGRASP